MNGDFSEKLDAVLGNPTLMAKLQELADSIKEPAATEKEEKTQAPAETEEEAVNTSAYLREKPENPALLSGKSGQDPVSALTGLLSRLSEGGAASPASVAHSKALLLAVKPYLDKERREKADKMIRMLALAELAGRWM